MGGAGAPPPPPPRRRGRRSLRELEEQTEVGQVFLRALMRRQLRLSCAIAASFMGLLGVQPLLAALWPRYGRLQLLGLPLAWLVLGVGSYPVMVALGFLYVRRAEQIDDEFSDLLG